jgi:hypothetical protein
MIVEKETRISIDNVDSEPRLPVQQPDSGFTTTVVSAGNAPHDADSEFATVVASAGNRRHLRDQTSTLALAAADPTRYTVRHVGDGRGPPATSRPKAPKIETLPTRLRRQARILGEFKSKRVSKRASKPVGVGNVGRRIQSPMGPRGNG